MSTFGNMITKICHFGIEHTIVVDEALDEALKSSYTNTVSWRLGIDMSSETDVLSSTGGDSVKSPIQLYE